MKNLLTCSLTRLGTDYLDVHRLARLDPAVPTKQMVDAGYVRHIGLSEIDAHIAHRAHAVHPISDLQIEHSQLSQAVETDVMPILRELGVGMTAYGVLSRGLLSGHWSVSNSIGPGDWRGLDPQFASGNVEHNPTLMEALRPVAEARG